MNAAPAHGGSTHRQLWLAVGGVMIVLLAAAVFTLGSLNTPFEPGRPVEILLLYALSTLIVLSFVVFAMILTRSLLRLWMERRAGQLGSRFRTKMVLGAMAISLLPVVFLFFISYALMNRTLAKWFPRPLEIATAQSQMLLNELGKAEHGRLLQLAREGIQSRTELPRAELRIPVSQGADASWAIYPVSDAHRGLPLARICLRGSDRDLDVVNPDRLPHLLQVLPSGAEIWQTEGKTYLAARSPARQGDGIVLVGRLMPNDFLTRYRQIEAQTKTYALQQPNLRAYRVQMLLVLLLFTLLLIFSATWSALFLSKMVTVPIQALAEATHEVAHGNLEHRVTVQARDELGTLVSSFNEMTAQLGEGRRQINEFNRSLQQAVTELDRRRKLMEAVLENIPTGVLSLDPEGRIVRANPAVVRIFGEQARSARTLIDLAGDEAARGMELLMRKALRLGVATREFQVKLPAGLLHAAVTVSALGPRSANPGYVVVVDDLTELLRAQKSAAWQEVAQRIAHEIKNPLTPIQLSAQRLRRMLEYPAAAMGGDLRSVVAECAGLIERELSTLKTLVDEFSQFARFPTVKAVAADANELVTTALEVFAGRLNGVRVSLSLAKDLPPVKADPELLRRVLVNLVDNAAEAMEGGAVKELRVTTRLDEETEVVEIAVADSGTGISPEDKDKLFLPHFSTKERGTGLGLAIAARIIAEHFGTLRVEDNEPAGARFVIRLPVAEAAVAPGRSGETA